MNKGFTVLYPLKCHNSSLTFMCDKNNPFHLTKFHFEKERKTKTLRFYLLNINSTNFHFSFAFEALEEARPKSVINLTHKAEKMKKRP